jgi:hypothetical protein
MIFENGKDEFRELFDFIHYKYLPIPLKLGKNIQE